MATGTIWSLPNYAGELFTADAKTTPILSLIGGMTGGIQTENFEFATDSQYALPAAKQPGITEIGSLTAPDASNVVRTQNLNVTQIFHEKVSISYVKESNRGRMSGLNTAGQKNNVATSEKDFQIARKLEIIARDIEHTIINGVYNKATKADEANKTRGLLEVCRTGTNITNETPAALTKAMVDALLKKMYDNGAALSDVIIWTNSAQKQKLSQLYTILPSDRNIGGSNIVKIETDFGELNIALNRFMPQDKLLFAEMSVLAPVFQPVPGKGNFFYEELAKTGASEDGQIFGQFGLDHGPAFMHGSIIGLA